MNLKQMKIFHNFGLKMLSLLTAMVLWLVIVNLSDPTVTRVFNSIPVEILNENAITEVNRVYEVTSGETVRVKVKGKRSVVDNINVDDFRATADLSELSKVNAVAINVNLKGDVKRKSHVELDWGNAVMQVKLEKKATAKFKVNIMTEGVLDSGYVLGEVIAQPNIVEVSGAKSTIRSIENVGVVVQLDGKTSDFTSELSPILYDSEGHIIKDNNNIMFNVDSIKVSTKILPTKTIPVHFDVSGKAKEGYRMVQTDYQPETIKISGPKDLIAKIDRVTVPLTIRGEKSDIQKEIDILKYLPKGVTVDEESEIISVRIVIEQEGKRTFILNNSDLKVINLPDKLNFSFADSTMKYEISVTGPEENLKDLTAKDLGAYIDVENLAAGRHTVTIRFELPDGVKTKSKVKSKIELVSNADTQSEPDNNTVIQAPTNNEE